MGTREEKVITMKDLFQEISRVREDSKKSETKISTKLDNIQNSLQPLREEVATHSREIAQLKNDKSRKNLVIFGLPQDDEESYDQLEGKVLNLFVNTMGVTSFNLMELDFIRRAKTEKPSKPVVLGLTTQRRKINILKNRGKLKGSGIYIHEDVSPEVKAQEKALRPQMYRLREEGKYAIIRGGKLITNDGRPPKNNRNNNKRALSVSPEEAQNKRSNLNLSNSTLMSMGDSFGEANDATDQPTPQLGEQIMGDNTLLQAFQPSFLSMQQPAVATVPPTALNSNPGASGLGRVLTQASIENYVVQNPSVEQDQKN